MSARKYSVPPELLALLADPSAEHWTDLDRLAASCALRAVWEYRAGHKGHGPARKARAVRLVRDVIAAKGGMRASRKHSDDWCIAQLRALTCWLECRGFGERAEALQHARRLHPCWLPRRFSTDPRA